MESKNTRAEPSNNTEEQADKQPKNTEPEPLMDTKELAEYLNVPISWIYEQVRLRK